MFAFELFYMSVISLIVLFGAHRYWLSLGCLQARRKQFFKGASATDGNAKTESLYGSTSDIEVAQEHSSGQNSDLASANTPSDYPSVLLQLPVFNEGEVVQRLLDSAAALDYPSDRLEIQLLDDSNDGSEVQAQYWVKQWQARGINIQQIRRSERTGYKAGALEYGLGLSKADFVAIFDADFVIPSDFLKRAITEFENPKVAMVQSRWGFRNEPYSLLTRVQALSLDGHFAVEHQARNAADRFFNFNGTGGIWRIKAIEDAGGWKSDTITEDLDLSLRAWMKDWKFVYRDDIVVPSDLPEAMAAYKVQQNRWVSGSIQTALKNLRPILSSHLYWSEKLDLSFYLLGNTTYLWLLLLTLSLPVVMLLRMEQDHPLFLYSDIPFFCLATLSVFSFYGCARRGRPMLRFYLLQCPLLMAVGIGMSLHNTRAIFKGLFGRSRVFERTPKGGEAQERVGTKKVRKGRDPLRVLEPLMAAYLSLPTMIALWSGALISLPFLCLFVLGYLFVSQAYLPARFRPNWGADLEPKAEL